MSMNDILDKIFEASGKLELMQALIGDLINKVEDMGDKATENAICFAVQKDTIASFLHIVVDGIYDSIKLLEEVQKGGVA